MLSIEFVSKCETHQSWYFFFFQPLQPFLGRLRVNFPIYYVYTSIKLFLWHGDRGSYISMMNKNNDIVNVQEIMIPF